MPQNQLKLGAIMGYAEILLTTLIGLVLTPFIIRSLGNSEYGLYTLIGSFVGYLSLMDLGLNNSIIRFVSNFRAKGDTVGEQKFLGTTLMIYSVISLAVIVLGLGLYFNLENIFSVSLSPSEMSKAKVMFLILIFNVAIVLPSNSFTGICTAYEAFVFSKGVRLLRIILRTATVYAILSYGGRAISLVVIDTVYNIIIAAMTYLYTKKKLLVTYDFSERRMSAVRPIFSYSLWIMLLVVISQFQWSFGQVLLGVRANTSAVAVLSIGVMLGTYYGAFSGVISGLFMPMTARIMQQGPQETQRMFEKVGRYNFVFLMLIILGFYFFGRDFISLWLKDEVYQDSWLIAMMIMVVCTVPLIQTLAHTMIEIKGYVKFKAAVKIAFLVLGFTGGYLLIPEYGGVGVMFGITLGLLASDIAMNIFFSNKLGLNIVTFFKKIFYTCAISIIVSIVTGLLLNKYIPELSWVMLIVKIIIFAGVYALMAALFCFSKDERKRLLRK